MGVCLWVPNCLDCTIETQATITTGIELAMNISTCCCRVGNCTLLHRLTMTFVCNANIGSTIGYRLLLWYPYQISVHAKIPYQYSSTADRAVNCILTNNQ